MRNIAIVGMGTMGRAIYDILNEKAFGLINGLDKDDDPNERLDFADSIVLAMKPQDFLSFAESVNIDLSKKLIISIMAGVSLEKISEALQVSKVVRVMPNLPLRAGLAFSGWFCSNAVGSDDKNLVKAILNLLGSEVEVSDEDQIDKITALSGSGPAYYFLMNKMLRMKALEMGFNDDQARKISQTTFLGAAKLLEQGPECSGEFVKKISSKGGTTEAALNHLEEEGFQKIFFDAVEEAYKKAKKLNE